MCEERKEAMEEIVELHIYDYSINTIANHYKLKTRKKSMKIQPLKIKKSVHIYLTSE